jgi:DNA helicase-2/ATP-dependent DNA helicase PcrA
VITPKSLRENLSFAATSSADDLAKVCKRLKKVSGIASLEGRYRVCGRAYVWLQRKPEGANREVQWDVNRWEPFCRQFASAVQMRDAIRQLKRDAVTTSTIHMAKGGEWQHVLIVGATDGLLPLFNSQTDDALHDERKLLYVAITRAQQRVCLYHAPTNHARSCQMFEEASRFLTDPAVRQTFVVANHRLGSA